MGKEKAKSNIRSLKDRLHDAWMYCSVGVWSDTRRLWWVNAIKTINLSVKSFLDTNLQSQACAMTYRTLLAMVPALALLFAIGRGFGFQSLLREELFHVFPGQRDAISYALTFVDSYLERASEGIFVGIGIVFLLWTLISLVSNVESSFNLIWGIKQGRSLWRKITDYTAMLLILPVLMICASGLSIFVSSALQSLFDFPFMTPIIKLVFEFASYCFSWLFFTAVFMLVPNTKVRFGNAFIAGVVTGTGFMILQWLFVTGQLYVSKYNAIYGSFSFLPLLLIWMQLAWVICLSGALLCYSSQNIFQFSFSAEINRISSDYNEKVTLAIATIIVKRFINHCPPVTSHDLIAGYGIPARLVTDITDRLMDAGIVSKVVMDVKKEIFGFQPAIDPKEITLNNVRRRLYHLGLNDFIPDFNENFGGITEMIRKMDASLIGSAEDVALADIAVESLDRT